MAFFSKSTLLGIVVSAIIKIYIDRFDSSIDIINHETIRLMFEREDVNTVFHMFWLSWTIRKLALCTLFLSNHWRCDDQAGTVSFDDFLLTSRFCPNFKRSQLVLFYSTMYYVNTQIIYSVPRLIFVYYYYLGIYQIVLYCFVNLINQFFVSLSCIPYKSHRF